MRVLGVAMAAIIPALLAVAIFAYPNGVSTEQSVAESVSGSVATSSARTFARTFVGYEPPPHVRVIPIYGATKDR
jgi:hypothetical protein